MGAAELNALQTRAADHTAAALKFITCGSVDDGKSTLIGRLLYDSRAVLQDQLASVERKGEVDLALLTDGLSAEREQGITIDVAYRYFATASRKFIIGDAPGHEQYTRNMVTATSGADAAVVLVDATKLQWQTQPVQLLPQTRRHSLLSHLLRVQSIVFAVNKLDAVDNPAVAFENITAALHTFAEQVGLTVNAVVPVSALKGYNVVDANPGWAGYTGPTLLQLLEKLPSTYDTQPHAFAFPVQWVEKNSSSSDTSQGRRVFWGRVASGTAKPGMEVTVFPAGKKATIAQVLGHARAERNEQGVEAGTSAGIILDREVDVSRGDWLMAVEGISTNQTVNATLAWLDDEPLVPGRMYWALHGHRWVKAKVQRITHHRNIHTLEEEDASTLDANAIGDVVLVLQAPIAYLPYEQSKAMGALVLVDTASNRTAAAVMLH
jgi:sulfate adenylyltransferase subunit 1